MCTPQVLACLLDPCRKSEEIASTISASEAWSELEAECSRFASATASELVAKVAAANASGQSGDAEDSGKRRWKGTLKERKERRIYSRVSEAPGMTFIHHPFLHALLAFQRVPLLRQLDSGWPFWLGSVVGSVILLPRAAPLLIVLEQPP